MSWLLVCGLRNDEFEKDIAVKAQAALIKNNFTFSSLNYIKKLDRSLSLSTEYNPQNEALIEKLRSLCRHCDVDPTGRAFTSHRKIIGPLIVKSKQILVSILAVVLKPTLEKQKNFNIQVIEFLAEFTKSK